MREKETTENVGKQNKKRLRKMCGNLAVVARQEPSKETKKIAEKGKRITKTGGRGARIACGTAGHRQEPGCERLTRDRKNERTKVSESVPVNAKKRSRATSTFVYDCAYTKNIVKEGRRSDKGGTEYAEP